MQRTARALLVVSIAAGAAAALVPLAWGAPPPPQPTDDFCRDVPDGYGGFSDIASTGNEDVIECLAYTGITTGRTATTYDPSGQVTRAQMATFVARALDLIDRLETGTDMAALPASGPNAFADDDGLQPHEASINRLAAAGVVDGFPDGTFGPNVFVNRAQMATFLNNAQRYAAGDAFTSTEDFFVDDNGLQPHEPNINGIAGVGIAQGVGGVAYDPIGVVSRNQMASFLIRYLAVLHHDGLIDRASAPGTPPSSTTSSTSSTSSSTSSTSSSTTSTTQSGPPPAPVLVDAELTHDAGTAGVLDAGDWVELCLSTQLAPLSDGDVESLTVRDPALGTHTLTNGGNAAFAIGFGPSAGVATPQGAPCPAAHTLVIAPTATIGAVPLTITGATGITDTAGQAYEPTPILGDSERIDVEPGPEPD